MFELHLDKLGKELQH